MGAIRAGAVLLLGVAALNLGNYVFHLLAARRLGPARYGDLATLVALASLIALPLGGVQVWLARYVAGYQAVGDNEAVHWFVRRAAAYSAAFAAAITIVLLTAAWPIQQLLGISSIAAVVFTALTALPAVLAPVGFGLAQGLQRFSLISAMYAIGSILRVGLTLLAFAVGLKVGGAMLATLVSMMLSLAIPLWLLRHWLAPAPASGRRVTRNEAAASLVPVSLGLLAITALTSIDVIVAKGVLGEHEAGLYGSASLIGRVILYLPSAIITVLLPRVAARAADRRESHDLLAKSILVTIGFCAVATSMYAAAPDLIVRLAFGSKFEDAAPLIWLFGLAMSLFAVLNVLLVYHLGREHSRVAWLFCGGAVGQLAAFLVFHDSARQLVYVDIGVAAALLVAHEVATRGLLVRTLIPPGRAAG
jgi:O-antigen/teichoic acid export membrane protein